MTGRLPKPSDHDARLAAARRRAGWELGDPSWADVILSAYANPDGSDADLRADGVAPEEVPQ